MPVHRTSDRRVAEHLHGERDGRIIRRSATCAQSVCDLLLHHDGEGVGREPALDEAHYERSGDIVRQIRHHLEVPLPDDGAELGVGHLHHVAEDDLDVLSAPQGEIEHLFEPLVHLEGKHFPRPFGKARGESARARAYLHDRIKACHAAVGDDRVEKVAVENEILPQRLVEAELLLSQNVGNDDVFHKFPPRTPYEERGAAQIKSVPKTNAVEVQKMSGSHPQDESRGSTKPQVELLLLSFLRRQ